MPCLATDFFDAFFEPLDDVLDTLAGVGPSSPDNSGTKSRISISESQLAFVILNQPNGSKQNFLPSSIALFAFCDSSLLCSWTSFSRQLTAYKKRTRWVNSPGAIWKLRNRSYCSIDLSIENKTYRHRCYGRFGEQSFGLLKFAISFIVFTICVAICS